MSDEQQLVLWYWDSRNATYRQANIRTLPWRMSEAIHAAMDWLTYHPRVSRIWITGGAWNAPLLWQHPEEAAVSDDAERAQARAEHLGELAAEREMVQAQTPVVNVQEEAE